MSWNSTQNEGEQSHGEYSGITFLLLLRMYAELQRLYHNLRNKYIAAFRSLNSALSNRRQLEAFWLVCLSLSSDRFLFAPDAGCHNSHERLTSQMKASCCLSLQPLSTAPDSSGRRHLIIRVLQDPQQPPAVVTATHYRLHRQSRWKKWGKKRGRKRNPSRS